MVLVSVCLKSYNKCLPVAAKHRIDIRINGDSINYRLLMFLVYRVAIALTHGDIRLADFTTKPNFDNTNCIFNQDVRGLRKCLLNEARVENFEHVT